MKRALKKERKIFYFENGKKIEGPHPSVRGNLTVQLPAWKSTKPQR